jgi:large subunit ribosomal protein L10
MAHVAESKKKVVQEFIGLMDKYPVIGVINMANLPTKTVQGMRSKLRDKGTVLKMTKKRLMKIAFSKAKKENLGKLQDYFKGMPALIFTEENPFKLYAQLERNKSSAPAKAGQEAPKNITVKAGPTSFSPGPIIGQLGKYGIKSGVEAGKLAIKEDAVVAKAGDVIDTELAGILIRLGIEPMEIGLDLTAVYENGEFFTSDVLHIDEAEYSNKFMSAYSNSFNLAVYVAYPNDETISALISKVANDSKSLALECNFLTSDTIIDILQKAHSQMISLSNNLPEDALSDDLKQGKATASDVQEQPVTGTVEESPKVEEKKEEKKEPEAAGLGSLFG